jgi:hypothetical protein
MAATATSAIDRLGELRQLQRDAEQRVGALEQQQRRARRQHAAAEQALAGAYAAEETGDGSAKDVDAARKALTALERQLRRRTVVRRGQSIEEWYDPEIDGRLIGAQVAVDDASSAVDAFTASHQHELRAELTERAHADRDAVAAAVEQLSAAVASWRQTRQAWLELVRDVAPAEIQPTPLPGTALQEIETIHMQALGGARDPRGLFPMPARFAPGGHPDAVEMAGGLRGWGHVPKVVSSSAGGDRTLLGA